ncbi:sulfatase family protein [Sphingomonas lycopersici]|uniref:Sulfatase n=1 Tax=Sphingomonas lycopersici TaxID=2951807 RepID=A0AA41ZDI0_9SPHN|nr:sulfatase [Sphingomonas lycopersici]MCW6533728.1 sulfatase [Sphingomonas lycopersici]
MIKPLRAALLAAAALIAPVGPAAAGTAPPRAPAQARVAPHSRNIIFVLVDDLRFDGMGFLQPALHTPNIDRMAREGSYFPNAVVTSSLCSPSRATILTGQTARNHRVVDNNNSSEKGLVFFPSYLQHVGYQTAFFGKWHMGYDTNAPRPGFDKWVSFKGQGTYWPKDPLLGTTMLNVDGKETPQKGYITDELTDYAMNWLEKERDPKKPFFLYLSHKAVHSDPLPPPRYLHQYDHTTFKLPASAKNTPENYSGKPRWVYDQRNSWHGIDFFYNSDVPMTEYLKYYYGALSAVDDSLGRIFAYLRKSHLDKDTLVVFTSDNGFQIGDHGLIDKRDAYEASVRVPLVVWEPGTVPAGKVNPGRVRNLDFAPTFLDLAGADRPSQFEGQSAWKLWNGSVAPQEWQPGDFVYEYYWEYNFPETPTTFAITRGNLKYIEYYGIYDRDELYDLSSDPEEMRNLADDPARIKDKIELRAALFKQLANREGEHMIPYLGRESTGAVRRRRGGTGAAPFPDSWYIEPNPTDRFDNIIPDNMGKAKAHAAGRPFIPTPPLIDAIRAAAQGGEAPTKKTEN